MASAQRYAATAAWHHSSHTGPHQPHGNPNFGQGNQNVSFHHGHPQGPAPQRNPNWGHRTHYAPFILPYMPQRGPNMNPHWGHRSHHVPFNPPHPPACGPHMNPDWGHSNHYVPFILPYMPQRGPNRNPHCNYYVPLKPSHPPDAVPHKNPKWGQSDNLNLGHSNHHAPLSSPHPPAPAPHMNPNAENSPSSHVSPYPSSPPCEQDPEDPPTPVQSIKAKLESKCYSQDEAADNVHEIKEEIKNLKNELKQKDAHLYKLEEKKREIQEDIKFERGLIKASNKMEDQSEFRYKSDYQIGVLKRRLENLNEAAEEREKEKKEAQQALHKLALLKKELQEKKTYHLELTEKLRIEEEAEKEIRQKMEEIKIALETAKKQSFSANEVQVSVEEKTVVAQPLDLCLDKSTSSTNNGRLLAKTSKLKKPHTTKRKKNGKRKKASQNPQNTKELSEKEVHPSPDTIQATESGHQKREDPEALPSEQTKPKKLSLWKRFKSLFTPRHRN